MVLPPAVIVHSLDDAKQALAPGLPVTLLSAPGAASYGGCLWWSALIELSGAVGLSLFDCGSAPGRALEALRLGLPGIVLTCEPKVFNVVAGIAATHEALLLPAAPPALNMAFKRHKRQIIAWLDDIG